MEVAAIPWADIAPFIIVGLFAQIIDSALGLGFGVLSNSLLVLLGAPPITASATTRTAESFTSGATGVAHVLQRNVDWPLFARLAVPGVIGGVTGIWALYFFQSEILRPVLLVYLVAVGAYLLWRAPRRPFAFRRIRLVAPLGFLGGFLDSSGGGGWGPLVTGNLLAQGMTPRMAVGTANAAEFFVTVTVLTAFAGIHGLHFTNAATGILIGGLVAAPFGAWLTRRMPPKLLLKLVGALLVATSIWGLASLMFDPLPVFPRI
ncbi:putative membrane protein YfcA [Sphingobium sp. B1D7B]|uniref:sulfite exporter TauE/SafE family protein n=1 Tax=Sphingobium sp. B1D7B TaxID=2940578 RepID=UPI0022257752|nr:sulfite exporter TauE/SafE family protein [Sphingobium sp. B1D7B]MCW2404631.1 putative membrane protein YfcA [Sphingobium sp. B1D7B]